MTTHDGCSKTLCGCEATKKYRLDHKIEHLFEALKFDYYVLSYATKKHLKNMNVIISGVKLNPCALLYADTHLRNNVDFISGLIEINPYSLLYSNLQNNKKLLKQAIEKDVLILLMVKPIDIVYYEKEILLFSAKINGMVIGAIYNNAQNMLCKNIDNEVVYYAIKQNNLVFYTLSQYFISRGYKYNHPNDFINDCNSKYNITDNDDKVYKLPIIYNIDEVIKKYENEHNNYTRINKLDELNKNSKFL